MKDQTPSKVVRSLPKFLPAQPEPVSLENFDDSVSEVQLREYLRVVIKYRVVIASVTIICTLLATVFAFTATPRYSAESKVRISTYEPVLTATKIEDMLQEKSKDANYLETQIQEMKSYSLADKVLDNSKIRNSLETNNDGGFWSKLFGFDSKVVEVPEPSDQASGYRNSITDIKNYLNSIEIKPVKRTSLVNIAATARDAQVSALMANTHASAYIDWVRQNRIDRQSRGLKFLMTQADELREKVVDLEREMADYAESNSIVAVNKDENITAQKMSQLNKLLTEATAKKIEVENAYSEAERALANPSAGYDDVTTQTMRTELAKLEAEYQQLSAKFMPSYPRMQQLSSQIQGLRHSIENQRKQVVMGMKAKMLAAREEEKNLIEELDQQKSQAFELSKRQVQYNVLNRELTSSRDLLENVLKQIKETSLAVESNASNVSVVDYAAVPQSPSFPRKKIVMFVGLLVGGLLGITIAWLLNYLDNSIRTPSDVNQYLKLPSLGVVPSFELELLDSGQGVSASGNVLMARDASGRNRSVENGKELIARKEGSLPPIVYVNDPKSLASEAYRTIRTGILLSQAGEPPRTILVSSAQSSEGKTTSSINLAASLASAGGRVVLIDADLRRPSLQKHFNLGSNEPGLVEVITGQRNIDEVAIKDVIKRVTLIKSGKIPPNPAELLGSLEMATIIDGLAEVFDYVLIDSPPVLPVTDSVILSRYVDGVVLVVRGSSTPRRVVQDAKNRLQAVGARLLGVVLNDVDVTGGDYYYYQRYYHSYYQNDESSAVRRPKNSDSKRAEMS